MAKNKEGRDDKGRFTIGHLWSIGNKGGHPPVYKTHSEIHAKIADYLEWEETTSKGKYTLEGCALYLGFATRKSLDDQAKRDPMFLYTIDRYRLFMAHYHAQGLRWAGSFQGSQFWLKNFGDYKDEGFQNIESRVTTVTPQVISGTPPIKIE